MSMNLMISFRQSESDDIKGMQLTRVLAGLTTTAKIDIGHTIQVAGIPFVVDDIVHEFQKPGSDIAPNSYAYARARGLLDNSSIEALKVAGFKEIL